MDNELIDILMEDYRRRIIGKMNMIDSEFWSGFMKQNAG